MELKVSRVADPGSWNNDTECVDCRLILDIKVDYLEPPKNMEDKAKREQLQTLLSSFCHKAANDPSACEKVVNFILKYNNVAPDWAV